ncbi:MAG: peptide chain release factor N(5)-glutamine methyltransferase, partial [Cyanobacteria bacterium HKST-UBA03]|nr:peptide chain release factor N(5)-glutamine methyltransferase [Cyanobacteria bacterium HKST-UBA03]
GKGKAYQDHTAMPEVPTPSLVDLTSHIDSQLARILDDRQQIAAERNLICQHLLDQDAPTAMFLNPDAPVARSVWDRVESLLQERVNQRTPLQYLLGEAWFYGQPFMVAPGVLIPRPETELLVAWACSVLEEQAQEQAQSPTHLLDLGTGSGCMAICLKQRFAQTQVVATDLSPDALAIARQNAAYHDVALTLLEGSWFEALGPVSPVASLQFDLIVCNPPYIDAEQAKHLAPELGWEPPISLFTDNPARLYTTLFEGAQAWLKPGGSLMAEWAFNHADTVLPVLEQYFEGVFTFSVQPDYAGHRRHVRGQRRT